MRLGGWTRIGIVASVLWAVVGGVYVRSAELNQAEPRIRENYKVCGNLAVTQPSEWEACMSRMRLSTADYTSAAQFKALVAAFVPIPFAWLFVWIGVRTTRWVSAGFRKSA